MNWIETKDKLPDEHETVWAYNVNTKFIALASLEYFDGWLWCVATSLSFIYAETGNIVAETELDDEYGFTHWMPLPKLPNK